MPTIPKVLMALTAISGTTEMTSAAMALARGGGVNLQLVTTGTVDGTWVIRGSNLPGSDVTPDPNASDITGAFKQPDNTAVAAVAHGTASTQSQSVAAGPVYCKYVWAEFTPSAGVGNAAVYGNEVEQV